LNTTDSKAQVGSFEIAFVLWENGMGAHYMLDLRGDCKALGPFFTCH
jgi:hypothetical protein